MLMRKRIYSIIEVAADRDVLSKVYDWFMMLTIILSLIPLCSRTETPLMRYLDTVTVSIFILDYLLRLGTADFKLQSGKISFIKYPFTPMAIGDLVSILPSLSLLNRSFKLLKLLRLARTLRVLRVFRVVRYSKSIHRILRVFQKQRDALLVVGMLALGYILISALVIFNVEPDSFPTFFDAVYWATVSLTTVGYGDIFAVTTAGRIITMLSSIFGIAIVALPAGIVTAGYMAELSDEDSD